MRFRKKTEVEPGVLLSQDTALEGRFSKAHNKFQSILKWLRDENELTPAKVYARHTQHRIIDHTLDAIFLPIFITASFYPIYHIYHTNTEMTHEEVFEIIYLLIAIFTPTLTLLRLNTLTINDTEKYYQLAEEAYKNHEISPQEVQRHLGPWTKSIYRALLGFEHLTARLKRD